MNQLVKPGRKLAIKQIVIAIFLILLTVLVSYFVAGFEHAKSSVFGGLVAVIPQIVFAFKAFQYAGASASKKVVDAFYSGVRIKLVLTAILFALCFKFFQPEPLPFFITYFIALLAPFVLAIANKFHFNQHMG